MDEHDRLRELSELVRRHLAARNGRAARASFEELLLVLTPHVDLEEGSVFPALRRSQEFAGHLEVLEVEHARLFDAVDELDDATAEDWCAAVLQLLGELDEHMYKEDFGLFPAALATLDGAEWDAIDERAVRAQPA